MDIVEELVHHLQIPESVVYLRREGFDPVIVPSVEVKSLAFWVMDYVDKYGKPPTAEAIGTEWDLDEPEPTLDIEFVLDKLKAKYLRKKHREVTERIVDAVDPDSFRETLISEAIEVRNATVSTKHVFASGDYKEMIEWMKEREKNKEPGLSYGFQEVDWHTAGAEKGHLSFLAARPKRFKSWILLQAAVEQRRQGFTPVLFTLELSREEMAERLMAMVSGVSFSRMKRKDLLPKDWKKIENAMEDFAALGPLYILSPPSEERTAHDFMLEAERLEAQSILVDQLSFIRTNENFYRENERYSHIVHTMKNLAIKTEIPWYVVCQLNREASNLENMADSSMVGLTRSIEETCDLLLGLHRTEDDEENDIVEMHVMEARHCPKGARWDVQVDLSKETSFEII